MTVGNSFNLTVIGIFIHLGIVLKELDNFIDTQKRVVDKDIKIAKIINENLKIGIM